VHSSAVIGKKKKKMVSNEPNLASKEKRSHHHWWLRFNLAPWSLAALVGDNFFTTPPCAPENPTISQFPNAHAWDNRRIAKPLFLPSKIASSLLIMAL
jgi:hypothetical protein